MRSAMFALIAPLIALSACGAPSPEANATTPSGPIGDAGSTGPATRVSHAPTPGPAATHAPATSIPNAGTLKAGERLTCAAEIGAAAASARVQLCRRVSPATHPPCNAANSCAMIEDEIARSCALGDDDGPPMPGCTPAPRSMAAAAAVVKRYYAAINARDFGTAWQQWGENGAPGQTFPRFAQGFAHTRTTSVTIGTMTPGSGGAGSIYQPVPVTVDATLDDGTHQRFTGSYTVRRVNNVDGASADQRRWHLGAAALTQVAAPAM